jgi:hypothetical protein
MDGPQGLVPELQTALLSSLNHCFADAFTDQFLEIASFLDPRIKLD